MSSNDNHGSSSTRSWKRRLLKVKVSWLERRCARRQVPFVMLSGQYRFTPEHLAEIVRLNEQPAGVSSINTERQKRRPCKIPRQPPDGFVPLRPRQRRTS